MFFIFMLFFLLFFFYPQNLMWILIVGKWLMIHFFVLFLTFPLFLFFLFFLTRNVNIDYVHIIHPPALF